MKTKLFLLVTLFGCILSSCTTYKAFMSDATNDPINQKLPKMEFEWFSGGNIHGANVEFVKNIIRNEINHNVVIPTGRKYGTIEVNCEKLHLKQNLALAGLSGGTFFVLNLLGLPFTSSKVDITLSFNIMDINGNVLDTHRYSVSKKSALGFYYGKDASVCMVEAVKELMKQFKNDLNVNANNIIVQLNNNNINYPSNYATNQPVYTQPVYTQPVYTQPINNTVKTDVVNSDVDQNIPQSNRKSEDTYVLIIANEDYQFVDDVNYATRDGEVFKEYCIKTLGIPERQIRYCSNASYGIICGGVDWMKYALNNFEGCKAIVYYCGHGIPDEKTGEAYIIPVDGKGTNTATCYSLNTLYKTLSDTKVSNITYFMDACFTGANKEGSMLVAARGIARKPKEEVLEGKTVVFSASSADETAMTYPEKGHGLFTYFLLKKLQETGGDVSYAELAEYINRNVKKEAFLINEKPQNPMVATSSSVMNEWGQMTLK